MAWEVNWGHEDNTGTYVIARNPTSKRRLARNWKLVATGYLRTRGVITPVFRNDTWEVDWSKRKRRAKLVWARNPKSKMPSAHKWHWTDDGTLLRAGIKWRPINHSNGRSINKQGYVCLTRKALSDDDILLCEKHNLFLGRRNLRVLEHRLIALRKYGELPKGMVVRHVNGIKTDNRASNLLLGTTQENTADHNKARMLAMYWRERAIAAESKNAICTDKPSGIPCSDG